MVLSFAGIGPDHYAVAIATLREIPGLLRVCDYRSIRVDNCAFIVRLLLVERWSLLGGKNAAWVKPLQEHARMDTEWGRNDFHVAKEAFEEARRRIRMTAPVNADADDALIDNIATAYQRLVPPLIRSIGKAAFSCGLTTAIRERLARERRGLPERNHVDVSLDVAVELLAFLRRIAGQDVATQFSYGQQVTAELLRVARDYTSTFNALGMRSDGQFTMLLVNEIG